MYIPTWLMIVIAIVGIYLYLQSKKKNHSLEAQNLTTEDMWHQAKANMTRVLEKSPLLENYLQDERDMVKAMERDMIRLRERYKHDSQKQNEIARDWMDYSNFVSKVKFAREILNVDMDDNAYDNYDERTKEAYIAIQEIAERVEKELGKDSSSKIVHDRLRKHAETINEIGEKEQKKGI